MPNVSVGGRAPDFDLPDEQVMPWVLSGELSVGPVVLIFYQGDWCPYCNGQLAHYARNSERFDRRGTRMAAISVDGPRRNLAMINKLLIPFPLLADPMGRLSQLYGLWDSRQNVSRPAVVVVDRSGAIGYLRVGEDSADRPAPDEVLDALDRLKGDGRLERGGQTLRVPADDDPPSLRPDRQEMPLDHLVPYFRGAQEATDALERRIGRSRSAHHGLDAYRSRVEDYEGALRETQRLHAGG